MGIIQISFGTKIYLGVETVAAVGIRRRTKPTAAVALFRVYAVIFHAFYMLGITTLTLIKNETNSERLSILPEIAQDLVATS